MLLFLDSVTSFYIPKEHYVVSIEIQPSSSRHLRLGLDRDGGRTTLERKFGEWCSYLHFATKAAPLASLIFLHSSVSLAAETSFQDVELFPPTLLQPVVGQPDDWPPHKLCRFLPLLPFLYVLSRPSLKIFTSSALCTTLSCVAGSMLFLTSQTSKFLWLPLPVIPSESLIASIPTLDFLQTSLPLAPLSLGLHLFPFLAYNR